MQSFIIKYYKKVFKYIIIWIAKKKVTLLGLKPEKNSLLWHNECLRPLSHNDFWKSFKCLHISVSNYPYSCLKGGCTRFEVEHISCNLLLYKGKNGEFFISQF